MNTKRKNEMQKNEKSLTALVWQHCPTRYSGTSLVVLLKIAGLSQRDGHAWVLIETLAAMCGIQPRTLRYMLARLRKERILKIHQRKGRSSQYFLNIAEIQKLPLALPAEAQTPVAVPEAQPQKTQSDMPRELQALIDAHHDRETVDAVFAFAQGHPHWKTQIEKNGTRIFVMCYEEIRKQYRTSKREVAA
jgi:hypothetical protein